MNREENCPCKSGKTFGECCGPILDGSVKAETAEALMRARYSAYVTCSVDFLKKSCVDSLQSELDDRELKNLSRAATWHGMEVISTEKGQSGDDTGIVEFRALYTANGEFCNHHERSTFIRENGEWKFQDGDFVKETPLHREGPKVGRNDPCPCGSGKKYKKCCGREK